MSDLHTLSQTFKPTDVRFTITFDGNHTKEEIQRNAVGIIERAKRFVENGYSCIGLGFEFKNIREH